MALAPARPPPLPRCSSELRARPPRFAVGTAEWRREQMKPSKRKPARKADDGFPGEVKTVTVPRNDRVLAAIAPDRIRKLREFLAEAIRAVRTMKPASPSDTPPLPQPKGFAARVARTACALCRGACCRDGGEHAYLDDQTMARVRRARPDLNARGVLRLYLDRVPEAGYDGSCVFHGEKGCTLDRSIRSDICNDFYCGGLEAFLTRGEHTQPVVIVAGKGDKTRKSPVLIP